MVLNLIVTTTSAAQAAAAAASPATTNSWVALGFALLGSSVLGGLITAGLTGLRATATARREGYAEATRILVARSEFPYRVRRRASDEPEVRAALAEVGHKLQEDLAYRRVWVRSESPRLGELFVQTLAAIDETGKPHTQAAWDTDPIETGSEMNLNGWGPDDPSVALDVFEKATATRFGWRRLWLWW